MLFKKIFNKGNLLYALFLLVFLIVCLEIFGRIYLGVILQKSSKPKFRFSYNRIYEHIPGFREGDGKRDWIVINQQGFRRTEEVSMEKPSNTIRIFLLGGSAAHGISSAPPYPVVHIYPDETIDAWLEKYLKSKHPDKKIEVINAAVTGYMVFQHTGYILSELLDYNPDIIIFFDGANDHYFNDTTYNYYLQNRYQFWKPRLQHPSVGGMFTYFMHWLSGYSGFARGYMAWKLNNDARKNDQKQTVNRNYGSPELIIETHKKIAPKQYLRAIETNLSILNNHGVKALVCLQPMLVLRDSTLYSPQEKSFYTDNMYVKILYPVVMDELKDVTSRHHVPLLDINTAFNDTNFRKQQLFIDYCHLTPLGGDVAARAMLPAIDSLIQTLK
jgi:lysophospholipase L1-like esterase